MNIANRKTRNKATTMALSFTIVGSMLFAMPGTIYAAKANTAKEENVYATLNEDGSVQGIYVVNAYDLSEDTRILDYGTYTSVKNLTNENTISENGKELSVDASMGKFYYQGNLNTKDLPWNIQIHYTLDGKEVNGEDLAGQSGALKIEIEITENEQVDASFFENYLLQATVSLPADLCTNIVAEGATIANISGDKQILFNVMGGQEKTLTITSEVTDFEMSAISFKGVPMSFDISLDDIDTSELTDKTEELQDGVTKLNDGATDLEDGTEKLKDGLTTYTDGVDTLYQGAAALASGVDTLQSGTTAYTDAVNSLADGSSTLARKTAQLPALMTSLSSAVSQLQTGSAQLADTSQGAAVQITTGLSAIEDGLQQMKAGLVAMNEQAIAPMLAGIDTMESQMAHLEEGIGSLETGMLAADQYVSMLQGVDSRYQQETETLSQIISQIPAVIEEGSDSAGTQLESSQQTETGAPQTTTTSETVTGEYSEDYTDTTTEELLDADGNTVTVITNNIYRSRDNTTTVTQETTTNTETVITQREITVPDASTGSIEAALAQQLGGLYQDMAVNAGTLHAVVYGDGSGENPGLAAVLTQCQGGVASAKQALSTGTQNLAGFRSGLLALQLQLVGEDGSSGAVASVQAMIDGIEQITYRVSGADNSGSLQSSLSSLNSGLSLLQEHTTDLPSTGSQLTAGITDLQSGLSQLDGNSSTLQSGVASLQSGATQLSTGAGTLVENQTSLLEGMDTLSEGMCSLQEGTQELSEKTSRMDEQIQDALEEKLSNFTGQDYEGISFVSAENTNVDAVQFAVQTQEIKIPETEAVVETQENTGFLDKLLELFTK